MRVAVLFCILVLGTAWPLTGQSPATVTEYVPERVRIVPIQGQLLEARNAVVVVPAEYEQNTQRYPVLYLLHGLWGGHRDWLDRTNLLQYTKEMDVIVVLPDAGDSWYANSVNQPGARFEDYVVEDIVGYVDQHFRTLPFPAARYIAGLSMGGFGAYKLALKHPGRFSLVASFSGAFVIASDSTYESVGEVFGPAGSEARQENNVVELIQQARLSDPPYFYLDCGTSDRLLENNRNVAAVLAERGLPYEYHEVAGDHSWEYWNRRLPVVLDLVRERVRALP